MNITDLIERVSAYDKSLAKDLSEYVRGREYGLVYEASKPEYVRLWNKPVVRGDLVNILPPRGEMEEKVEDSPSTITYRYISKNGTMAKLRNIKTNEECEAEIENLVAISRFDQPIYCGLKEKDRIERGGDSPYHVVINGENYHALQTLVYAYAGKVDCIYIDPPYNTGAKDWKYNNNYVSGDDIYRHSKWLTFMEDRLKVAKKLLNPKDSVLIVTIDEKEYLRLGLLLEQLFPEASNMQMISALTNSRGVARDKGFARVDEYIYVLQFGKNGVNRLPLSDEWRVNVNKDKRVTHLRWSMLIRSGSNYLRSDSVNQFYPVFVQNDGKKIHSVGESFYGTDRNEVVPPEGTFAVWPIRQDGVEGNWQVSNDNLRNLISKGYVQLGKLKNGKVPIYYLKKGEIKKVESGVYEITGRREDGSIESDTEVRSLVAGTQWRIGSHDASTGGTGILKSIFGESPFTFPKSLYSTYDTIRFFVADKPNALIVDFFSGSGTTLHAVNLLNSQDGGHRSCIAITNNEVSIDEQKKFTKKKLRQGDKEWEALGIATYVTWPRTKCSISGKNIKGKPLEGKYYGTDTKMSDGFDSNAIMYELTYLEPSLVAANVAFNEIAPILWLKSGCRGEILQYSEGYAIGETYAVLFDYSYVTKFTNLIKGNKKIAHIFIVTDTKSRYRSMCAEFPNHDVVQLYESYFRSFEINTEV